MYTRCFIIIIALLVSTTVADSCKRNERYVECDAICNARTCKEAGFPVPCYINGPCPGKPGCICIDGFLRHDNGTCIPKIMCPSCGGDDNAIPGCSNPCGRVCPRKRTRRCAMYCLANGCDCKADLVLNRQTNKCVKRKECDNS